MSEKIPYKVADISLGNRLYWLILLVYLLFLFSCFRFEGIILSLTVKFINIDSVLFFFFFGSVGNRNCVSFDKDMYLEIVC